MQRFVSMLLEEAAPELKGPTPDAWFDRLEREDDRLRAALEWCLEHDPELGRALGGAVWPFWMNRSRIPEGRQWLDRLLAAPTVELQTLARARALYGAGTLAFMQGDGEAALVSGAFEGKDHGVGPAAVGLSRSWSRERSGQPPAVRCGTACTPPGEPGNRREAG